jgi:hypothetical protein
MPAITAFPTTPALIPDHCPQVSADFDTFDPQEIVGCPWYVSLSPAYSPATAPAETHYPVEANGRTQDGYLSTCYFDDYYYRIHIAPPRLDLGNIVSTLTERIHVWNAWLTPQTLESIEGEEEGLSIVPVDGQAPPTTYSATEERAFDVTVTPQGVSRIDAALTFIWDNLPDAILIIVGDRAIIWAFPPDWTEPIEERLSFLTDILTSRSGLEQRRALRISPRRSFNARFIVEGDNRSALDFMLASGSANAWSLPIWPDVQFLAHDLASGSDFIACATANKDFVAGGMALLIPANLEAKAPLLSEAVEIAGLPPTASRWSVPPWKTGPTTGHQKKPTGMSRP